MFYLVIYKNSFLPPNQTFNANNVYPKSTYNVSKTALASIFLCSSIGFSQTVSVNNSQSAQNLVDMLLNNACANVSNVSSSSIQATGSFSNNGGAFPIADGVVIRTGNAAFPQGVTRALI